VKWNIIDGDFEIRQQYWMAGWQTFQNHVITGYGLTYLPNGDSAHNLIIDLLASQGLIGFLFFVAFVALTLNSVFLWSVRAMAVEDRIWRIILLSTLLFIATHSMASGIVMAEPELFWVSFLFIQLAVISQQRALRQSTSIKMQLFRSLLGARPTRLSL
jgi:O-antigen ligase